MSDRAAEIRMLREELRQTVIGQGARLERLEAGLAEQAAELAGLKSRRKNPGGDRKNIPGLTFTRRPFELRCLTTFKRSTS